MGAISSWRFDTSVEFQVDTGIAGQWGEAAQLLHRRLQSASSLHWRWPLPAVSWRPNTAADSAMALSPRVSRCDAAHAWRQKKVALWNRDWESPGWLIWGYQSQNLQWWTIPKLWGLIIGDNSLFCGTALRTDQSLLQYSGVDIVDQKGTLGNTDGLTTFSIQTIPIWGSKETICVCVCTLASLDVWPPVRCLGLLDSFGPLMWVVAGACGILLCYIRGCCFGCHVECQRRGWPFRRYTSELEVPLSTDSVLFLLVPHRNLLCFFQKGQFLAQHGTLSRIRRLTSCWPYCKMLVLVWARWYCPL